MNEYIFALDPMNKEVAVVADTEKQARAFLWAEIPDAVKNCIHSIECVEYGSAMYEQRPGVQGCPF